LSGGIVCQGEGGGSSSRPRFRGCTSSSSRGTGESKAPFTGGGKKALAGALVRARSGSTGGAEKERGTLGARSGPTPRRATSPRAGLQRRCRAQRQQHARSLEPHNLIASSSAAAACPVTNATDSLCGQRVSSNTPPLLMPHKFNAGSMVPHCREERFCMATVPSMAAQPPLIPPLLPGTPKCGQDARRCRSGP